MSVPSDIEIAQSANLRPIIDVAAELDLTPDDLDLYGKYKAKIPLEIASRPARGKLVLVTAINPTAAGEGKTTTSVGLAQAFRRIGKRVALCIREPSLGPVFGVKGGAAGGGYAQVLPMDDINLHFTGDFHAISSTHALLAALLDNHLQQGNTLGIDPRRITWPRTIDMNDRALRKVIIGLGGPAEGVVREERFVIIPASEIMAIVALASSVKDLEERLARIIVGSTYGADRKPVRAGDLKAAGAMGLLLKDAIRPNLVQTLEGGPAFVHAGPFGNIAHAANSIVADRIALKSADYVVTEAGFASDLGFQKFCDIVCRVGGFSPSAAVLVTTVRATKSHGGKPFNVLGNEDLDALAKGADNLAAHVNIVRQYGLPCVVAINSFPTDTARELALVRDLALKAGAETVVVHSGFSEGGAGATELANAVTTACDKPNTFSFLTPNGTPLVEQIEAIATKIYGASGIDLESQARKDLEKIEKLGLGHAPVCMAKTHLSLSHDPSLRNRPTGFILPVRGLVPSAGAEFVVALCGEMQRMPGLGKTPAFMNIDIDGEGRTVGLF